MNFILNRLNSCTISQGMESLGLSLVPMKSKKIEHFHMTENTHTTDMGACHAEHKPMMVCCMVRAYLLHLLKNPMRKKKNIRACRLTAH